MDLRITDINDVQVDQLILVPGMVNGKEDMVKARIFAIVARSPYLSSELADRRIYAYGDNFAGYYTIDEIFAYEAEEVDDHVPF